MTDDLRFDELLREDAAALPPPADGEITPWRTAMDRILWGMGLTTITLNFLWLDVLLPAIGAVLLVLGFRTLRRENAPSAGAIVWRCWRWPSASPGTCLPPCRWMWGTPPPTSTSW